MLLAVGGRENRGAAASVIQRAIAAATAAAIVIAIEMAIAIVVVAIEVAIVIEMVVVVLALAWARSVRGASGVVVLPVSGFLV